MKEHLCERFPGSKIEMLDSRHPDRYKSFKLLVKKCDRDAVIDANFWPSGVKIKHFFQRWGRAVPMG